MTALAGVGAAVALRVSILAVIGPMLIVVLVVMSPEKWAAISVAWGGVWL